MSVAIITPRLLPQNPPQPTTEYVNPFGVQDKRESIIVALRGTATCRWINQCLSQTGRDITHSLGLYDSLYYYVPAYQRLFGREKHGQNADPISKVEVWGL